MGTIDHKQDRAYKERDRDAWGSCGKSSPSPPSPPPPPEFAPSHPRRTPEATSQADDCLPDDCSQYVMQIREELLKGISEPEGVRKMHMRELQRRWHPDKNSEADKVIATAVFQYIISCRDWYLA